jgi:hypothetical protein
MSILLRCDTTMPCVAACFALCLVTDGPASPEKSARFVLDRIVFEKGFAPNTGYYANGSYRVYYDGAGMCSLSEANHLAKRYNTYLSFNGKFEEDSLVGLLGGVFKVKLKGIAAVFIRVADEDLPKAVTVPHWDSLTVPLTGNAGFHGANFSIQGITTGAKIDTIAVLKIKFVGNSLKTRPDRQIATVKAGDYLLIRDKGHLVRAVVSANPKTSVAGWVELSPEPIPEQTLLKDKKRLVRPEPDK